MSRPIFQEYKHSNTVQIIGFAQSSRDLAFKRLHVDRWGLNEAHEQPWWKGGETGWFQIHPKFDYMRANNRNSPTHWPWLQQFHDFPIFMMDKFEEVPNSVRYPLELACTEFGQYFTSTPAYELALAMLMGYERIEIYGIEMSADSEYVYQKAGFEYLIGVAKGRGHDVYLPPECSLLRANLYAYEDLRAASRTYYGFRQRYLKSEVEKAVAELNLYTGRMQELQDVMQDPKAPSITPEYRKWLADRYVLRRDEHLVKMAEAGARDGALTEINELVRWHDSQNIPLDREPVVEDEVCNVEA
jgi:hypothetical protein